MITKVEEKIKELQELKSKEYYKQKDADLENWGIAKNGKGKKATPLVISDDEYEKLIKISNGVGNTGRNVVAISLRKAAGVALFVCIVAGVVSLFTSASKGFIWFSLWLMAGFAFATLFKGIAEAIRLLQQLIDGESTPVIKKAEAPVITTSAPMQVAPGYIPVQPPIYPQQAPQGYVQPVPQAYYTPAPPITTAPAATPKAEVEARKSNDYNSMPVMNLDPKDDFFTKPYEPKSTFGE